MNNNQNSEPKKFTQELINKILEAAKKLENEPSLPQDSNLKPDYQKLLGNAVGLSLDALIYNNSLSALTYASAKNNCEIVKILIEAGATLDLQGSSGSTALMIAAAKGRVEAIELLIKNGAQPDIKDDSGQTALNWAVMTNQIESVKCLVENKADVNNVTNDGFTVVMHAVRSDQIEIIQILLDNGANIEAISLEKMTALMYACATNKITTIKMLLKNGADVNVKNADGITPLIYAAGFGDDTIIHELLERSANIEETDKNGNTALMYASQGGHESIVKYLIKKGANVNAKSNNNETSLMLAAQNGRDTIVQLLLKNKADTEVKNSEGETALEYAIIANSESAVKILIGFESNFDISTNLTQKGRDFLNQNSAKSANIKKTLELASNIAKLAMNPSLRVNLECVNELIGSKNFAKIFQQNLIKNGTKSTQTEYIVTINSNETIPQEIKTKIDGIFKKNNELLAEICGKMFNKLSENKFPEYLIAKVVKNDFLPSENTPEVIELLNKLGDLYQKHDIKFTYQISEMVNKSNTSEGQNNKVIKKIIEEVNTANLIMLGHVDEIIQCDKKNLGRLKKINNEAILPNAIKNSISIACARSEETANSVVVDIDVPNEGGIEQIDAQVQSVENMQNGNNVMEISANSADEIGQNLLQEDGQEGGVFSDNLETIGGDSSLEAEI